MRTTLRILVLLVSVLAAPARPVREPTIRVTFGDMGIPERDTAEDV